MRERYDLFMDIRRKIRKKGFYIALGVGSICVLGLIFSAENIKEAGDKFASINKARNSLEEDIDNNISTNYVLNDEKKEDKLVKKDNADALVNNEEENINIEVEKEIVDVVANKQSKSKFSFDEEKGLAWPINGNIIKNYSIDRLVYFPTLKNFKANPAIFIEGKENDAIKAAARGKITRIEEDIELGKNLELEIGNNYKLIYGQLKDISVSLGDEVKEGQVIATLAKPTNYYTEEGTHLYFQVKENDEVVNPLVFLK